MNKRQAIKALKFQKAKLKAKFIFSDYSIWHGATMHYIESIFGKESYAYNALSQFRAFDIQDTTANNYYLIKANLEKLFDEFIGMVQVDFYNKPQKANFLQNLDIPVLIFIISGLCTGCFIIGKCTSDVKNMELIQGNKKLLDSIGLYRNELMPLKDSLHTWKQKSQSPPKNN